MADSTQRSGGVGFLGLLTLLLIALKLTNQIDWSWWWVLAPSWVPFAILLTIVTIGLVCHVIIRAIETPQQKALREFREASGSLVEGLERRRHVRDRD